MATISGPTGRPRRETPKPRGRSAAARLAAAFVACATMAAAVGLARADGPPEVAARRFPTVPAEHRHARALLENSMRFLAPMNKMIDPASGYPFEGWNHDPAQRLFLRSFTQLTAIGKHMELLADIVAGRADSPEMTREQALEGLTRLVTTLRRDQNDPSLGVMGLLVNFLDLATGKRLAPLTADVEKRTILGAFGAERGEAIWRAMRDGGWIVPRDDDTEAAIRRGVKFGFEHFDGPLSPYKDDATRRKLMEILDRRVVMVIFGDNANLSASVAKTIGALLAPEVAGRPEVAGLRGELEAFLEGQKEGYARLYDAKAGLFYFGWDATKDRLFGWVDAQGNWTTGHMDYFVNEFRAPAIFVSARYGLPPDAIRNMGFRIKPYRMRGGAKVFALAPWDGSAFQAMGLNIMLRELDYPVWRELLTAVVDIEIDYAARKGLPGFLSESYTGDGAKYTGDVGIPEITVNPKPRITDAASLYTLGVAYTIAPEKVERFLGANWPVIATLLTDHGPWEGFNVTQGEAIRFQTTAHTLSLIQGILATGPDNMRRYAEHAGIAGRLEAFFPPGERADLLADGVQAYAWSDKEGGVRSSRDDGALRIRGESVMRLGVAFVPTRNGGVSPSGGHLTLRYRLSGAMETVLIALKAGNESASGLIPKEIVARLEDTEGREGEVRVPLPASVGLMNLKEVVLSHETGAGPRPIDLTITGFEFRPTTTTAGGAGR